MTLASESKITTRHQINGLQIKISEDSRRNFLDITICDKFRISNYQYLIISGIMATLVSLMVPKALYIFVVIAVVMNFVKKQTEVRESLMLIDIGIQFTTVYQVLGFKVFESNQFYHTESIKDILINEYFRNFEVVFYLVLVVEVENDKELVVMFPQCKPRLETLQLVYNKIHKNL